MRAALKTYVVTGSASGMGREATRKLRAAGHTVIGVDLHDADVIADLSTPAGRRLAADDVLSAAGGCLDGAILAAGLGPTRGPDRSRIIFEVNYFGVVNLLTAWRHAFARSNGAKVVVIGSNSTTTTPVVPKRTVRALLSENTDKAVGSVRMYFGAAPAIAYAASKTAVTRWVRRHAVTEEWAGRNIRLNVLAPGAVMTPLLEKQLATPSEARAVRWFPVPVGGFGDAAALADWMLFMLSDAAEFLCGSVIFVDGGSDAYFRPDHWPDPVPASRTLPYLWRFARFRRNGR
jgi:NAD(P)-dependent dehydrogenase (short-subunit alcohol dehydrogenase family)